MKHYQRIYVHGHFLADKNGRVAVHRLNLFTKIGEGFHACHWCGNSLEWLPGAGNRYGALVVNHLDGDIFNNDVANLVPACGQCNSNKERAILESDVFIIEADGRKVRARPITCALCGKPGLTRLSDNRKDRARHCSRTCANRAAVTIRHQRKKVAPPNEDATF